MPPLRLSALQARRVVLAAQGFAEPRPAGRVDARHVRRAVERLGLLQLDSVNVFCRSHYLPLLARLGPYPTEVIDAMAVHHGRRLGPAAMTRREVVESWAHEASLVPVTTYPLLGWRRAQASSERWSGMARGGSDLPVLAEQVAAQVAAEGPIRGSDTGFERMPARPGHMWNWHDGKVALEFLWRAGRVCVARRVNFERWYDVPERVLPPPVIATPEPDQAEAQRGLVAIAARAQGVATLADLADHFRMLQADTRVAVDALVAEGRLVPAEVEGWSQPAWLWAEARRPRAVHARALLSPFDSLVWFRPRTQRIWDFHYRIEIYTPAHKRIHGYYVLPFLLGDDLAARVDLKTDRAAGVLRVQGVHLEPGHDARHVAAELAAQLAETAGWLGMTGIEVTGRGDLAPHLRSAL